MSKKASCTVYGDLGTSLLLFSSRLFVSIILPGTHSSFREKRKVMMFVYLKILRDIDTYSFPFKGTQLK